jgi:hypothetical protein
MLVRLGYSSWDDYPGVFVAYKNLGPAHAFEKVGSKTLGSHS